MVLRRESVLFQWRNSRSVGSVFASSCEGVAASSVPVRPCEDCHALWRLHRFQVVLNRQMPDEGAWKFTPKVYRNGELGAIYLKYKGVRELIESVRLFLLRSAWFLADFFIARTMVSTRGFASHRMHPRAYTSLTTLS